MKGCGIEFNVPGCDKERCATLSRVFTKIQKPQNGSTSTSAHASAICVLMRVQEFRVIS